jgi:hypothetical protein
MEDNEVPKWANFICPSCAISYGVKALIKAIRKRQQEEKGLHQNTTKIQGHVSAITIDPMTYKNLGTSWLKCI